ncbi:MAG: hypothetical protein J0G30_03750 [Actinomycetales bacterium]|nr:hypothetical protein [Actinomycetales bacterium]
MSTPGETPRPGEARVRRAPRIGVFLVVGGLLGLVATLIVTSLFPADPKVGFWASYLYFCLYGVPAGLLLGALVALPLDARSRRRARTITVESERVGATEPGSDPAAPDGP